MLFNTFLSRNVVKISLEERNLDWWCVTSRFDWSYHAAFLLQLKQLKEELFIWKLTALLSNFQKLLKSWDSACGMYAVYAELLSKK